MPMRIIDISPNIASAYADALAKMQTVELAAGTPVTRGVSTAYQFAVKDLLTEIHYGPKDNLEWPRRAALVTALLTDIELEYLKHHHATEGNGNVRFVLDDAACALEKLVDLISEVKPEGTHQ